MNAIDVLGKQDLLSCCHLLPHKAYLLYSGTSTLFLYLDLYLFYDHRRDKEEAPPLALGLRD